MTFSHQFTGGTTYFALTYPFSYSDGQGLLEQYEKKLTGSTSIYFKRELLGYSIEKRRVDLITISSFDGIEATKEETIPELFPSENAAEDRPNTFKEKEVVFATARVHPGEVQGSHMVNGLLAFLLKEFVFVQARY